MWVEFTIRIRQTRLARMVNARAGNRIAEDLKGYLKTDIAGSALYKRDYRQSQHCTETKATVVDSFVTGYESRHLSSCRIFWLEDVAVGSVASFFVVGEKVEHGHPEEFAMRLFEDIEQILRFSGYEIATHSLSIAGVQHQFTVNREEIVTADIIAPFIVAIIWSLISLVTSEQINSPGGFLWSFGINVAFALSVAGVTMLIKLVTAKRKVVYRGGQ